MNIFNDAKRIIITCSRKLAPYLELEVVELGFKIERTFLTGVEIRGNVNDCIKLNLNLRCASQVHYSLKEFTISSADDLYHKLLDVEWEKLIKGDGYFSVTSNVNHPSINNEMFVNVRVKDAIVDRFRRETGQRPDSGSASDGAVIYLYWNEEQAEVFIDTSGQSLAKHGYRKI